MADGACASNSLMLCFVAKLQSCNMRVGIAGTRRALSFCKAPSLVGAACHVVQLGSQIPSLYL